MSAFPRSVKLCSGTPRCQSPLRPELQRDRPGTDSGLAVQSLSCVQLFLTPRTVALQAPLSSTVSRSLLRFMSIESVMPSNYLILCRPLLSVFPSIRAFSSELALCPSWPKYWSFSISPSSEYSGLIPLGLTGLLCLLSRELSRVFSSTTI